VQNFRQNFAQFILEEGEMMKKSTILAIVVMGGGSSV